jgi:hypothetical protein
VRLNKKEFVEVQILTSFMKEFIFPMLCAAAGLPFALGTPLAAQPSTKGGAHVVSFQDPDPDSGVIDESSADYDVFYERLSSDGNWFYDDDYGYVWQPNVAVSTSSWQPYTDGHWVWTDRGWCWVSNEDFGWATYHYGRWIRVAGVGWVWVPGDEWAPGWVSWRHTDDDDYVGWAPLPPEASATVDVGVHSWCDSYYDIGPAAFAFIRIGDFCRPSYREFIVPPAQNVTIINRTQNITNIAYNNNVIYNYGPKYERVSEFVQRQGQQVPNYKINYTPQLQRNAAFRTEAQGNSLRVIAPPAKLKPVAATQPAAAKQLGKAQVDRGWKGLPQSQAEQIHQKFVQQTPVPKTLPPKPVPPPKAQVQAARPNQPGPGKPGTIPPAPSGQPRTVEEKALEQQKGKSPQPPKPGKPVEKASETQKRVSEKAKTPPAEQGQPHHAENAVKPHPQPMPQIAVRHIAQQPHPQNHPQPHPPSQPQPHPQAHPQPHPPSQPQPHPQAHPQPHSQPQKAENKNKKKER